MTDQKKMIIKGLELCGIQDGTLQCNSCPYVKIGCLTRLKRDALSLLKAQEQDAKKIIEKGNVYECPWCGEQVFIDTNQNYCGYCGKPVTWDG